VQPRGSSDAALPSYLGLVLTLEDLAIYGLVTSTKLKILLLLRPGEGKVKDLDCLTVSGKDISSLSKLNLSCCVFFFSFNQILRAIHTCYLSYISNPFQSLTSPSAPSSTQIALGQASAHVEIHSQLFEKRIRAIGGW